MKKLLAVLLAVLLLAVPALAQEQTVDLSGVWEMSYAMASGMTVTPEMIGFSMKFVLNPDGTGTFATNATGTLVEEPLTWTQAGYMATTTSQVTGEVVTLSLQSDGTLRVAQDQVLVFLTRTSAAPQATSAPGGGLPPLCGQLRGPVGADACAHGRSIH